MSGDELFEELPEQTRPQTAEAGLGAPRLREPQRDQIELRAVDIESLIGDDHPARVIWAYRGARPERARRSDQGTGRPAGSSGNVATAFAGAVALCHQ